VGRSKAAEFTKKKGDWGRMGRWGEDWRWGKKKTTELLAASEQRSLKTGKTGDSKEKDAKWKEK